jgi:hypothetical protein
MLPVVRAAPGHKDAMGFPEIAPAETAAAPHLYPEDDAAPRTAALEGVVPEYAPKRWIPKRVLGRSRARSPNARRLWAPR